MAKKIRPSLKDYLRTGVVRFTEDHPPAAAEERELPSAPPPAPPQDSAMILALLSERDRRTWEPIFNAGTEIRVAPLDLVALREVCHAAPPPIPLAIDNILRRGTSNGPRTSTSR